jgi:4-hydroxyphenylpyruvate dioxygenase-like putative hemolysin
MNVEYIEQFYPNVYETSKNFYMFDYKVNQMINDNYGINTFKSILKSNEYTKEIDNVRNNIIKDTQMNKLAQKYKKYFDLFTTSTYELKQQIGLDKTSVIIDFLREHFKLFSFLYL